jgi:hypothetical protein
MFGGSRTEGAELAVEDPWRADVRIKPVGTSEEGHLVEADFQVDSSGYRIYFRSDDTVLTECSEALIACALLPAMRVGGVLSGTREVSRRFAAALPTIQDIYATWDRSLERVELRGVTRFTRRREGTRRVGAFFSGGVDSFYTLLKHRDEITDLIFILGFDMSVDDAALYAQVSEMLDRVAASFEKRVVRVETNVRTLLDPHISWGMSHGAALAAVGHCLAADLTRLYVPSTHAYGSLFTWGSHPLLDPLWSSETLEFVHDGCEATRLRKAKVVSQSDVAMRSLRVCWKNTNGAYNCGRCEKCLRTMVGLYAAGALDSCTTFREPLDVKRISNLDVFSGNKKAYLREYVAALEGTPRGAELRKALYKVMSRLAFREYVETTLGRFPWLARVGGAIARSTRKHRLAKRLLRRITRRSQSHRI